MGKAFRFGVVSAGNTAPSACSRLSGRWHGLSFTHKDRLNADLLAFIEGWPRGHALRCLLPTPSSRTRRRQRTTARVVMTLTSQSNTLTRQVIGEERSACASTVQGAWKVCKGYILRHV